MHVLVVGTGSMGKVVVSELHAVGYNTTVTRDLADLTRTDFHVIIDFSHVDNLSRVAKFSTENNLPVVIATTGFSELQLEMLDDLSQKVPVLYSANYSLGVILMNKLIKQVTQALHPDFDIEILEKHHKHKLDSPSGTAKMLLNSIQASLPTPYDVKYGREGFAKRKPNEIGIHSLRGGAYAGEHHVIFSGEHEVFSVMHEANSKHVFAKGAILGAKWLVHQPTGRYTMEDVLP